MSDRAVSQTLNYTLTLGIATILVVGLLTAGGNFVENQRNSVIDSELEVIGERLSADIATADRLVRISDDETSVSLTSELPRTVAGLSYSIDVVAEDGNVSLELTTSSLGRTITTKVANKTALQTGKAAGGDLVLEYNPTAERLEVTDG